MIPDLVAFSNVVGFCIYLKLLNIRLIKSSNWLESKNCVYNASFSKVGGIFFIGSL